MVRYIFLVNNWHLDKTNAGCTRVLAKSGIADLRKLSVPLDTYYFCQNYNSMFNFNVKLTRQQSKM
jgi:hypothetical protein